MYRRWTSPNNGNGIFWYSFDYGAVHVVQMSTEHDWTRGSAQYNWLKADLAAVNRSVTPWIVLTGHRMMYTTQMPKGGDYIVSQHMQAELGDLLYAARVNLMLTGHQHSYERTCPVYNGKCVENGQATVQIVVGSAGAALEDGGFSSSLGPWSIVHEDANAYGYCRITATMDSMDVEFVQNVDGTVFDSVSLTPWF